MSTVHGDEVPDVERRLVFKPASTITPRPVRWAWDTAPDAEPGHGEGRFPVGSLCLTVGRAGVGKSQFAAWAAANITRGTLPGHFYGKPRAVVYCASEDSWAMTIVPRLMAAGADLDLIYRVDVVDDDNVHARLTLPADTLLLERGIREYEVAMVVLDPLLSAIDSDINDYRAREVREALEPLVAVADRTQALLLGLAHFTKSSGSDPLMLVSGSAAFGQLVRAAVAFACDTDGDEPAYVASTIKSNLGREDLPSLAYRIEPHKVDTPEGDAWVSRLEFTGEDAPNSVHDLLRAQSSNGSSEDSDDVRGWLHSFLARHGGSAPPEDVNKAGKAAGYTPDQLRRAKKPKGRYPEVYSRKTGMVGGWVWSLEEDEDGTTHPEDGEGGTRGERATFATFVPSSGDRPLPSDARPYSRGEHQRTTNGQSHGAMDRPCDRCEDTPTRVNGHGRRLCQSCAPSLWVTS